MCSNARTSNWQGEEREVIRIPSLCARCTWRASRPIIWAFRSNIEIVIDLAGNIIHEYPLRETMTSWDRLQRLLRQVIPSDRYHLGQNYIGFEQTETQVIANFENGRREKADLLIGADGFARPFAINCCPTCGLATPATWCGAALQWNRTCRNLSSTAFSNTSPSLCRLGNRSSVIPFPVSVTTIGRGIGAIILSGIA